MRFKPGHFESTAGRKRSAASTPPLKASLRLLPNRRDVYRAKLVFYLLLVSLGVFFLAAMAAYCAIRLQSFQPIQREYLTLEIPIAFWASTLILVVISVTLQRAVWLVRRQQLQFLRWMVIAWFASIAFLGVQYFGMVDLLETHFTHFDGSSKVYGLCFTLALVHALHVAGGIVFLAFVIWQGIRLRYDHERHFAVEHCASYWHFLDFVWLMMLLTFLITG